MRSAHLPLAVGRPIKVKQKDHPSTADLEEVQERYIAELKRSVPILELSPLASQTSALTPRRARPQDLGGLQGGVRQEPHQGAHHHRVTSAVVEKVPTLAAALASSPPLYPPILSEHLFTFCAPLLHTALLACSEQCPPSLALERLVARRAVLLRALAASREPESPESARPDKHSCSRPLRDAQRVVKLRPCLAAEDSSEAGRPAGTGKPWSAGRLH